MTFYLRDHLQTLFLILRQFQQMHLLKLAGNHGFTCLHLLNLLTTNLPKHIETTQLIWNANQLTGFYMMGDIGR